MLQMVDQEILISIEGVIVRPGDIIVADGDGVVAMYARKELEMDKEGRRKLYDILGWQYDDTVK